MASGLLFLLLLGIGGNIYCEAAPPFCPPFFCRFCPFGWTQYGGHCYQFQNQQLEWADAETFCKRHGGHLTSIQDTDQYNFIRELIFKGAGTNQKSWVGGTNAGRVHMWRWTDGTPFTFDSWGPGEPNNQGGNEHCMDMNLFGQDYVNDEDCSQQNSFVCIRPLRHIFPPQD
ncbi:galactose-specific lectin nattectin-like [Nothobranchius furzeri]|uniref:galactose-specific lectin nattectin-like n=1 Tax=Nothobranchius furzeri TaxID=105023 RepID=UPI0024048A73|nr:galactose-specific lectin nattectin-like [Nothobranchius furzeri]